MSELSPPVPLTLLGVTSADSVGTRKVRVHHLALTELELFAASKSLKLAPTSREFLAWWIALDRGLEITAEGMQKAKTALGELRNQTPAEMTVHGWQAENILQEVIQARGTRWAPECYPVQVESIYHAPSLQLIFLLAFRFIHKATGTPVYATPTPRD